MKAIVSPVVVLAALLASCSAILPLQGRMERSSETFTGTVSGTGYRQGTATLTIVSDRRATCQGDFVHTSRRRGEGVLRCDDGRSGAFHVVGVDSTGSGVGDLDGKRFTFTFGTPRAPA